MRDHLLVVFKAAARQNHAPAGFDVERFATLFGTHPKYFFREIVLDQGTPRGFVENGDGALFDQTFEPLPGVGIAIRRPVMEFVHAVCTGQVRELDSDRLMLVFLGIATDAFEPGVVLAHLFRPHLHHGLRHRVVAAQGVEISGGFVDGRGVEIALSGHAGVAAFLPFRRFFQHDDFSSQIVGGDGCRHARGSEPDDHDICFDIPLFRL